MDRNPKNFPRAFGARNLMKINVKTSFFQLLAPQAKKIGVFWRQITIFVKDFIISDTKSSKISAARQVKYPTIWFNPPLLPIVEKQGGVKPKGGGLN